MSLVMESMTADHWREVAAICREGLATGHASFASEPPEDFADWMDGKLPAGCIVARDSRGPALLGWATLSKVSDRCVYGGVAEVSLYVAAMARCRGVGGALLRDLITRSDIAGIWTLQAGIFPENKASLALHAAHGFRMIGVRERIGRMSYGPSAGRWRDTLLLERRSAVAGTD